MKKTSTTLLLLLAIVFASNAQSDHHLTLLGQLNYPNEQLSSLWGYEAPDGTPYAIVGTNQKVSIVSLANPAAPVQVATVPGPTTIWREMKVWGQYAYVSLDNVTTGMQIIDLQYLPDSVRYINWKPDGLQAVHTVSMDENGIMIVNGSNLSGGAPRLYDVKVDPWNPSLLGIAGTAYAHDSYARGDTLWVANINEGYFTVYDITDKANPVLKGQQETPNKFTHNIWPTDDNQYVFTTDEVSDSYVTAYNVSDLTDIKEVDRWQESYTGGKIPHNVHVRNDFVITAHYSDGTVVLDGHRPNNLVEVARYDSHLQPEEGFTGVWGAYPYFAGNDWILASDMQNGLIILQPDYQRACYVEGKITNLATGQNISNARVELLTGTTVIGDKTSNTQGNYGTGTATAGTYTLRVSKSGYFPTELNVALSNGVVATVDVLLEKKPTIAISGKVVDAATGAPIENAKVVIKNADFTFELQSDTDGDYFVSELVPDVYDLFSGKWGYKTVFVEGQPINSAGSGYGFALEKGYEDPFSVDLGWQVSGSSFGATWERGTPLETAPPAPGFPSLQPGYDGVDPGNSCYVTGNSNELPGGLVYGGTVVLESPAMDLSNITNPQISFASWYVGVFQSGAPSAAKIRFKMTKGVQSKTVFERSFSLTEPLDWQYDTIKVADFLTPGPDMRFRVEVGNGSFDQFFEGLFDDFKVSAGTVSANEQWLEPAALTITPNPSSSNFGIRYQLEQAAFDVATMRITNAYGVVVAENTTESPNGEWIVGKDLPAGVYFVQLRVGNQATKASKLVKQ